jgi:hypothetical protein
MEKEVRAMSMENMRRGAQTVRGGGGGGGKGPRRSAYFARWKPPQMLEVLKPFLGAPPSEEAMLQVAEPVVLIAGAYVDQYARDVNGNPYNPPLISEAYRFRSHTFKVYLPPQKPGQKGFTSFRELVCSCGSDSHAPQNCVGCYQVDHGAKDSKPRDQWALNVAHLAWYHKHPLIDKQTNQIQVSKQTGQPTMVKDECFRVKKENEILARAAQRRVQNIRQPRVCETCNAQTQAAGNVGSTWDWGDHRVLQVGWKHLKRIMELDEELGKKCANCQTHIIRMRFNCSNESCNHVLVEIASSGWTNDQIKEFENSIQQCPSCGTPGRPYSEYECGFNEQYQKIQGGCADDVEPRKMSAFDCVLWMQREGEGTESDVVIKRIEPIANFVTPDGRPLREHLSEIVKAPYDLAEMYKSDSLDEQAELIKVQNPYAQAQYQQYGAPTGYPQVPGPQSYGPTATAGYGPPQQQQPAGYPNMPVPGRPNYGK